MWTGCRWISLVAALLLPPVKTASEWSAHRRFLWSVSHPFTVFLLRIFVFSPIIFHCVKNLVLMLHNTHFVRGIHCIFSLCALQDFSRDFSDLDGVVQQRRQEMMESSSSGSQTPDYDKIPGVCSTLGLLRLLLPFTKLLYTLSIHTWWSLLFSPNVLSVSCVTVAPSL